MTLIEIFSGSPIENIISTLAMKPQKTIFVCTDSKKAWREIPRYKKILSGRGISCEMNVVKVPKNDLDDICAILGDVMSDENENYVVDISGGDSTVLAAVGMTIARINTRNIFAFRINPVSRRGTLFRFGGEGGSSEKFVFDFSYNTEVYLTCEENIILHGGTVCGRGERFDTDSPLVHDVEALWKLCKADPTGWNAKIGKLSSESSRHGEESDVRTISKDIIGSSARNGVDKQLWKALVECGFIIVDTERSKKGSWFFRYKNKLVEECLNKSGSILEYRTYLAGIRAKHDEDIAFCSVETGITIGWDEGGMNGTQNEIDCMLMCGVCPIFISCKNGEIKTEELYKLGTVSEEFGSNYTRAVLLSTVYFDERVGQYGGIKTAPKSVMKLKKRASDMNIKLISKAHLMGENTFDSAIASLAE